MAEPAGAIVTLAPPDRGWLRDALRRLLRNRPAVVGTLIRTVSGLMERLAPVVAHPE